MKMIVKENRKLFLFIFFQLIIIGFMINSCITSLNYKQVKVEVDMEEMLYKYVNFDTYYSKVYPVGSIYVSTASTNPSSTFGGTWVEYASGRMLVSYDSTQTEFDTIEETGGSKDVEAHTHAFSGSYNFRAFFNNSQNVSTADAWSSTFRNMPGNATVAQSGASWDFGCKGKSVSSKAASYMRGWGTTSYPFTGSSFVSGGTGGIESNTGGNMQPYVVVYMWKRTA